MTYRIKIILLTFFLSLPFWWGINVLENKLEDFFFWQKLARDQIFAAQISLEQKLLGMGPIYKNGAGEPDITAKSIISVFVGENGQNKILFQRNTEEKLPIASLAKLMTAKVVFDNYDLKKHITVSKEAVMQEENFGDLKIGGKYDVEYLLYALLIESSNDAAYALAADYEGMTYDKFVGLMNKETQELGLLRTYFFNPTGLDSEDTMPKTETNYSTAKDLAVLAESLLDAPLVWEILSTPKYSQYGTELDNTNMLLDDIPGIIGGKTGYTGEAGKCMLLVLRSPKNRGLIVNVILGANNKFSEMKKLTNWLETVYKW